MEDLETNQTQNGEDAVLDPNKEYVTDDMIFIDTRDMTWPLTMMQIRRRETYTIFAPTPELVDVEDRGYAVIHPTEVPTEGHVTEVTPQLVDGKWYRTYTTRPFTPEELQVMLDNERNVRLMLLGERLVSALARGKEVQVEGNTYRISMSDTNANDLGTQLRRAMQAIDRGQTTTFKLRTVENQTLTLSAEETVDLIDEVMAERQRLMEVSWDLEDLLAAAETMEELPTIPEVLE